MRVEESVLENMTGDFPTIVLGRANVKGDNLRSVYLV